MSLLLHYLLSSRKEPDICIDRTSFSTELKIILIKVLPHIVPRLFTLGKFYCMLVKVTMNKLCACLFIIIFMTYTRKSECIPTVTNFASILANYFYFLRKITALRPSVLNFRGRLAKFCQKSSGQTVRKWLFRSWFTKNAAQNFM